MQFQARRPCAQVGAVFSLFSYVRTKGCSDDSVNSVEPELLHGVRRQPSDGASQCNVVSAGVPWNWSESTKVRMGLKWTAFSFQVQLPAAAIWASCVRLQATFWWRPSQDACLLNKSDIWGQCFMKVYLSVYYTGFFSRKYTQVLCSWRKLLNFCFLNFLCAHVLRMLTPSDKWL